MRYSDPDSCDYNNLHHSTTRNGAKSHVQKEPRRIRRAPGIFINRGVMTKGVVSAVS